MEQPEVEITIVLRGKSVDEIAAKAGRAIMHITRDAAVYKSWPKMDYGSGISVSFKKVEETNES
jgi:hypothetical protein